MRKILVLVVIISTISCKNSTEEKAKSTQSDNLESKESLIDKKKAFIRNEISLIDSNLFAMELVDFVDVPFYQSLDSVKYSRESTGIYNAVLINMLKYYDSLGLKKIILDAKGPYRRLNSEYYLHGDSLIFNRKSFSYYNEAIFHDDYDSTKTKIEKCEFYILTDSVTKPNYISVPCGQSQFSENIVRKDFKVYFEYSEYEHNNR